MDGLFLNLLALLVQTDPVNRLPSFPYISGDTFCHACDYVIDITHDENKILKSPGSIAPGSRILVRTNLLGFFFHEVHPLIQAPYILITHNNDSPCPGPYAPFLDDPKILRWYGQNALHHPHPKLRPIPIGIPNRYWPHGNIYTLKKWQERAAHHSKIHLLYMNFAIKTAPEERQRVWDLFSQVSWCKTTKPTDHETYLKEMVESRFVLSPPGVGWDCHRTWEAMLLGTIPIIKTSLLDSLYADLPVLIIQDWEEITPDFLEAKSKEMESRTYALNKLYMDYWIQELAKG